MIAARSLQKWFGALTAISDVSFVAPAGAVTGLLGANGAGKTTTLRMLSGLLQPDAGEAVIDEVDVRRAPLEAKARVGVLPDGAGLYARLTPRDHLTYAARLHGLRGPALSYAVDAVIHRLDLAALADRPVAGFSQGERKQVGLARALVHDPPNLILDEPTAGLDVPTARRLRRTLRALAEAGKCVLLSTHVMQEVANTCDRIVLVGRGRVVAEGTPDEFMKAGGSHELEEAFVRLIGSDEGLG